LLCSRLVAKARDFAPAGWPICPPLEVAATTTTTFATMQSKRRRADADAASQSSAPVQPASQPASQLGGRSFPVTLVAAQVGAIVVRARFSDCWPPVQRSPPGARRDPTKLNGTLPARPAKPVALAAQRGATFPIRRLPQRANRNNRRPQEGKGRPKS